MGKAGRPTGSLKYTSKEALDDAVESFFIKCEENNKPPVIEKLADHLGISVKTLYNYGTEGYSGELDFLPTIQRARDRCIAYAAERLFDKDGVQGAKFYLTNNAERMGGLRYADRQEVSMDVAPINFVGFPDDG